MELLVEDTVDEILKANPDLCGCQRCRLDLIAVALNKLPPAYVVTEEGEVRLRANILVQQYKVDIIRAVAEATSVVSKNPHHHR